jgi:hypothetical protein
MSNEPTALAQAAPAIAEDPATPATNLAAGATEGERIDAYTSAVLSHAPAATIERLEAEMREAAPPPAQTHPAPPTEGKEPDRFRFKDAEDRTIAMIAKSKGISLAAAARLYTGGPESDANAASAHALPVLDAAASAPEVNALESQLAELRALIRARKGDGALPTAELDELEDRRASLVAQLAVARQESRATQRAREEVGLADFERGRNAVLADTVQAYPAMRDGGSALYLVARALAEQMHDPRHPDHARLLDVEAPRFIAEKAAEKLGVKPATIDSSPSHPQATAPAKRPGPAPGSRQSAAPTLQKSEQELLRDSEQNLEAVLEGRARAPVRKPRSYAFA